MAAAAAAAQKISVDVFVGNTSLESMRGTVVVEAPFESMSNFQEKVFKALKEEQYFADVDCPKSNNISVLVINANRSYVATIAGDFLSPSNVDFAVLLRPKAALTPFQTAQRYGGVAGYYFYLQASRPPSTTTEGSRERQRVPPDQLGSLHMISQSRPASKLVPGDMLEAEVDFSPCPPPVQLELPAELRGDLERLYQSLENLAGFANSLFSLASSKSLLSEGDVRGPMQLLLQLASYLLNKQTQPSPLLVRSELSAASTKFSATATADAVLITRAQLETQAVVFASGMQTSTVCSGVGFVAEFKRPRSDRNDLDQHHPQVVATIDALSHGRQYAYGVLTNMFIWRFFVVSKPDSGRTKVRHFDLSALHRDSPEGNIDGTQLSKIVETIVVLTALSQSETEPTDLLSRLQLDQHSQGSSRGSKRKGTVLYPEDQPKAQPPDQPPSQSQDQTQGQAPQGRKRKASDGDAEIAQRLVATAKAAARAMDAFVADGIADPVDHWLLDEQTILAETLAAWCRSAEDKRVLRDIVYNAAMPVAQE